MLNIMQGTDFKVYHVISFVLSFCLCGACKDDCECLADTGDGRWNSIAQRWLVSYRFSERPVAEVLEKIIHLAGLAVKPSLSIGFENKTISGSLSEATFLQAAMKVADLAHAEMAIRRSFEGQTLLCLQQRSAGPFRFHAYKFVGPFCVELSRLGADVSPEPIRNTWRLRVLGLPEDGEMMLRSGLVADSATKRTAPLELLRLADHSGDIVRTIGGGTYDNFFAIPTPTESNGFSCRAKLAGTQVVEWIWASVPLRRKATAKLQDVTVDVENVSDGNNNVEVKYRVSWPSGLTDDAKVKQKQLLAKVAGGGRLSAEESKWLSAISGKTINIRDYAVVDSVGKRLDESVSISKERPGQGELKGTVCFARQSAATADCCLRIQLAHEKYCEAEIEFDVPPVRRMQVANGVAPGGGARRLLLRAQ